MRRAAFSLSLLGLLSVACYRPAVVPPTASIPQRSVAPAAIPPVVTIPDPVRIETPTIPAAPGDPWKPTVDEREWKFIVLHHSATDSGDVDSIHQSHLKNKDKNGKPWLGIGYHFVIGNGDGMGDGEIEATFRWRQQLQGAHAGVGEYNQNGIGICLIGNFDEGKPSGPQLTSVKQLVGSLKQSYQIDHDHVVGHGDVKSTECPGKYFPLDEIRLTALDPVEPASTLATMDPRRLPRHQRLIGASSP